MIARGRTGVGFGGRQAGFTLVELLVAMAIFSVVAGMLTLMFYQLSNLPRWGGARLAVDADLRNAGIWLARDGSQAWNFAPGASPIYGTFAITRTGSATATVTYRFEGGALRRDYETAATATSRDVARHIERASDVAFTPSGQVVTVEITATSGSGRNRVSDGQTFTVTMRAAGP